MTGSVVPQSLSSVAAVLESSALLIPSDATRSAGSAPDMLSVVGAFESGQLYPRIVFDLGGSGPDAGERPAAQLWFGLAWQCFFAQ